MLTDDDKIHGEAKKVERDGAREREAQPANGMHTFGCLVAKYK